MSDSQIRIPVTFWIVSAIAILWNIIGIVNFVTQVFMLESFTAEMTAEQKELFYTNPVWMKVVFAIAVIGGLLGSIGLVMRKKWSVPVLFVSLIAVVIQMGYSSLMTDALEIMGQSPVFPTMLVIFSVILWYYAKRSDSIGYLN